MSADSPASPGFATRAVHVGQEPDPRTGAVVPPLHLASTYRLDTVETTRAGFDYARGSSPTRAAFEETLASLEGGAGALTFPSGLSAEDTVLRVLTRPGDTVGYGPDVYGGTYRLLSRICVAEGRRSAIIDLTDVEEAERQLRAAEARVVWVETPSNPLLTITDIAAISEAAHRAGAVVVVDNTFATPYLQRPLEWGADVVVHSTTKYVGGHSDTVGGAVVVRAGLELPGGRSGVAGSNSVLAELDYWRNAVGAAPGAFDSWLGSRGLKTLAVRVERHCASARVVADHLRAHPDVADVHYPGFPDHPGHEIAARQMSGFGGIISLRLGSAAAARALCENTEVFSLAVSLGAVESLIEYPATMTHGAKADSITAIPSEVVRLSIGLEDPADLIEDLDRALEIAVAPTSA